MTDSLYEVIQKDRERYEEVGSAMPWREWFALYGNIKKLVETFEAMDAPIEVDVEPLKLPNSMSYPDWLASLDFEVDSTPMMTHVPIDTSVRILIQQHYDFQRARWGTPKHTPSVWHLVLTEEVGKAAKAITHDNLTEFRSKIAGIAALCRHCLEVTDVNVKDYQETRNELLRIENATTQLFGSIAHATKGESTSDFLKLPDVHLIETIRHAVNSLRKEYPDVAERLHKIIKWIPDTPIYDDETITTEGVPIQIYVDEDTQTLLLEKSTVDWLVKTNGVYVTVFPAGESGESYAYTFATPALASQFTDDMCTSFTAKYHE